MGVWGGYITYHWAFVFCVCRYIDTYTEPTHDTTNHHHHHHHNNSTSPEPAVPLEEEEDDGSRSVTSTVAGAGGDMSSVELPRKVYYPSQVRLDILKYMK